MRWATETLPDLTAAGFRSKLLMIPKLQTALEILAAAKRPVAILGTNAMRMRDIDLLRRFVERHGIPFASTTMTKRVDRRGITTLSVGCIERARRQIQREFLARCRSDHRGSAMTTIEVEYEAWIGDTPLLQIDIEKVDIAPSVQLKAEVTGDLDTSFATLTDADSIANDWQESDCRGLIRWHS